MHGLLRSEAWKKSEKLKRKRERERERERELESHTSDFCITIIADITSMQLSKQFKIQHLLTFATLARHVQIVLPV